MVIRVAKLSWGNRQGIMSKVLFSQKCQIPVYQHFHTCTCYYIVNKEVLSKLRKKTGFSISLCKKALELHESDIQKAEEWLTKEAQTHGWAKATKLLNRAALQGLIGIHIKGNVGALVEVNCETDFVAKNEDFKSLVSVIAEEFATSSTSLDNLEKPIKETVDKEALNSFKTKDGKSLSDLVALTIGRVGENIQLTRGVRFISPRDFELVGYAHPSSPGSLGTMGRYGAVVAFKNASNAELTRQLCAHIVGMNPNEVGSLDDVEIKGPEARKQVKLELEPPANEDELLVEQGIEEEKKGDKAGKEETTTLVLQDFLSDSEVTVGQVLKENNYEIIDFVRLACGETQKQE